MFVVVAMCLIVSGYSVAQGFPSRAATAPHTVKSAETVHAALQPWLRAIESMFSKTNDVELTPVKTAENNH
jgi:hypothetical protein